MIIVNQCEGIWFSYDTETGRLFKYGKGANPDHQVKWRECCRNPTATYGIVNVGKNRYQKKSRLIWFLVYGYWPNVIDHIDRDSRNDALTNLRNTTPLGNKHNATVRHDSASGIAGVTFDTCCGKYRAYQDHGPKRTYLSYSDKLEEAVAARQKWEQEIRSQIIEQETIK